MLVATVAGQNDPLFERSLHGTDLEPIAPDDSVIDPWICAACGVPTGSRACSSCRQDSLLRRRYRLTAILGRGTLGCTYRAEDIQSARIVAVRQVPLEGSNEAAVQRAMAPRIDHLIRLRHPGVAAVQEHFVDGPAGQRCFFLVRELVEGRSLATPERGHGVDRVLRVMGQLLKLRIALRDQLRGPVLTGLQPTDIIQRSGGGRLVLVELGGLREAMHGQGLAASEHAPTRERTELHHLGLLALSLITRDSMFDRAGRLDWEHRVVLPRAVHRLLKDLLDGRIPDAERALERTRQARRALGDSWSSELDEPEASLAPAPSVAAALPKAQNLPPTLLRDRKPAKVTGPRAQEQQRAQEAFIRKVSWGLLILMGVALTFTAVVAMLFQNMVSNL